MCTFSFVCMCFICLFCMTIVVIHMCEIHICDSGATLLITLHYVFYVYVVDI